jgi:hypothetical protein
MMSNLFSRIRSRLSLGCELEKLAPGPMQMQATPGSDNFLLQSAVPRARMAGAFLLRYTIPFVSGEPHADTR